MDILERCLNPFMNQVYFYPVPSASQWNKWLCLNPFMNQVYFYAVGRSAGQQGFLDVLIPL